MGKTTAISEVNDLFDLIELYANLDLNNDGLLGPDEVLKEEVKAGDRGGTNSATYDVKDGFLSPWEVAQMQGLGQEETRRLRIANQIHHVAFNDIESLPKDTEINGGVFKAGTPLRFHRDGKVANGVRAGAFPILMWSSLETPLTIPAESVVSFKPDGTPLNARLSRDVRSTDTSLPADTVYWFDRNRVTSETEPIIIDNVAYSEFNFTSMIGTLAREAELPFTNNHMLKVSLPAGQSVNYDQVLKRYYVPELTRETTINGVSCPEGTRIFRINEYSEDDALELQAPEGKSFTYDGARIQRIQIRNNLSISLVAYAQPHSKQAGGITLKVRLELYQTDGTLRSAWLAEDLPSPYSRSRIYRAGSTVAFFDDGELMEGSPECFRHRYPRIALSGKASEHELLVAFEALEQMSPVMRAAIRGMSFGYDEVPHPLYKEMAGFAHPMNGTMYLRRSGGKFRLDSDTITHEAAHLLHLSLQRKVTERIAAATRHLDPSRPEDLAEDAAISERLFSQSFDARWISAAGYDFGYSVADLASYWLRYSEYATAAEKGLASSSAANGFLHSYGRVSIWEDIATTVESVSRQPESFALLLNEDSYYYDDYPEEKPFSRVYRRKYDLLVEYGFISREVQRKVLAHLPPPMHPEMAAFCANLNCP